MSLGGTRGDGGLWFITGQTAIQSYHHQLMCLRVGGCVCWWRCEYPPTLVLLFLAGVGGGSGGFVYPALVCPAAIPACQNKCSVPLSTADDGIWRQHILAAGRDWTRLFHKCTVGIILICSVGARSDGISCCVLQMNGCWFFLALRTSPALMWLVQTSLTQFFFFI